MKSDISIKTSRRGTCAVCRTSRPVLGNGTVRAHRDPTGYQRCTGSGWGPAREVTEAQANRPKLATCSRCGGAYMQGKECGLCAFDRRHPEIHEPAVDEVMEAIRASETAKARHAVMLAEANALIEATMGSSLSDAAALELLLIGVAVTSVEEVAALVDGIVGDDVDDATFADLVDALTPQPAQ